LPPREERVPFGAWSVVGEGGASAGFGGKLLASLGAEALCETLEDFVGEVAYATAFVCEGG
jgi:hypothetical protein